MGQALVTRDRQRCSSPGDLGTSSGRGGEREAEQQAVVVAAEIDAVVIADRAGFAGVVTAASSEHEDIACATPSQFSEQLSMLGWVQHLADLELIPAQSALDCN